MSTKYQRHISTCPHIRTVESGRLSLSLFLSIPAAAPRTTLLCPLCTSLYGNGGVSNCSRRPEAGAFGRGASGPLLLEHSCLLQVLALLVQKYLLKALDAEALMQKSASRCFFHFDTPPHEHIDVLQCRFTLHSNGVPADTCCC
jgi:hypothetical protein